MNVGAILKSLGAVRRGSNLLRCKGGGDLFKDTKEKNERMKEDLNRRDGGERNPASGTDPIPRASSIKAK